MARVGRSLFGGNLPIDSCSSRCPKIAGKKPETPQSTVKHVVFSQTLAKTIVKYTLSGPRLGRML